MIDRNLVRGLFLMAIAAAFGGAAFRYPVGDLSRAGPGLFPLMISGLLALVAVSMIVRSRFVAPQAFHFEYRNIALILGSLCGFAVVSLFVNMTAGIVFMVFCSSLAGTSFSIKRNLKISLGLLVMAFVFQRFLGLNLPLI